MVPVLWAPCEYERDGWLGIDDDTVGLKVTVLCGFAGICCLLAFDSDDIRGVVSVEELDDAIVTNPYPSSSASVVTKLRLPPPCAKAATCHNGDSRNLPGPSIGVVGCVLMGEGTVDSL